MSGTLPSDLVGVRSQGQTVVRGALLDLETRLDAVFVAWGRALGATENRYPPVIDASHLARLDWFASFPHLATFPVAVDRATDALDALATAGVDANGAVQLERLDAVRHVLTPAACYHLYVDLEGRRLDRPHLVTTRATCFRREDTYTPLERQWGFSMREIVILGTPEDVTTHTARLTDAVTRFQTALGLDAAWTHATDPFFRPARNPAYLVQRLEPVKHELVFDGRLAIASTNLHHDHFGRAFQIERDGAAAFSGCVAFGMERWLAAFLARHGPVPADWPELPEVCVD